MQKSTDEQLSELYSAMDKEELAFKITVINYLKLITVKLDNLEKMVSCSKEVSDEITELKGLMTDKKKSDFVVSLDKYRRG